MALDQPYILSYVKNLSLAFKVSCNTLKALLQESETVTCAHTVVTPRLQKDVPSVSCFQCIELIT